MKEWGHGAKHSPWEQKSVETLLLKVKTILPQFSLLPLHPHSTFPPLFHDSENPILSVQVTKMSQVRVLWSCCCFKSGLNTCYYMTLGITKRQKNLPESLLVSWCCWTLSCRWHFQGEKNFCSPFQRQWKNPLCHKSLFAHPFMAEARGQCPHREETGLSPVHVAHRAPTHSSEPTKGHSIFISFPWRL